jgi:RecG-like helicase
MADRERQTAYKVWISNILNSLYTKSTGEFVPNFITCNNLQISRVNIIASVVDIYHDETGSFSSLTLDDGSATIVARTFKEDTRLMQDNDMGDVVLIIGKIKEYNGELYLVAEIVKKLTNPLWGKVRRQELLSTIGEAPPVIPQPSRQNQPPDQPVIQEVSYTQTVTAHPSEHAQKVLEKLGATEEGLSVDTMSTSLNLPKEEIEKSVLELMKNNDIYQNKPGCYKIL